MPVFHSLVYSINDIKLKPQINFQKKVKQNHSNVQLSAKIAMKILKKKLGFWFTIYYRHKEEKLKHRNSHIRIRQNNRTK